MAWFCEELQKYIINMSSKTKIYVFPTLQFLTKRTKISPNYISDGTLLVSRDANVQLISRLLVFVCNTVFFLDFFVTCKV